MATRKTDHPEIQLLLCCAKVAVSDEVRRQIIRLVEAGLDWPHLLRQANRHGMLPLLFRRLRDAFQENPECPHFDALRLWFHAHAKRNQLMAAELLEVLDLFEKNGIEALAFKGPVLAIDAYGDLALRQFGDLDLLIDPKNFPKARDLLLDKGYRRETDLNGARQAAHLKWQYEENFVQDNGLMVDLHWQIAPDYPYSPRTGCHTTMVAGRSIPTLGPFDRFLYLCRHGAKHGWERLAWIRDLAGLLQSLPEKHFEPLRQKAARYKLEDMLLIGLFLAQELTGTVFPARIRHDLNQNKRVRARSHWVMTNLFDKPEGPSIIGKFLFYLQITKGISAKTRFMLSRVRPVSRDLAWLRLPATLLPLYYLVRPLRLTHKYLSRPMNRRFLASK